MLVAHSCPTLSDPMECSPQRLLCPWNSPCKNTGVGCHFLLQDLPDLGSNLGLPHCRQILYHLSYHKSGCDAPSPGRQYLWPDIVTQTWRVTAPARRTGSSRAQVPTWRAGVPEPSQGVGPCRAGTVLTLNPVCTPAALQPALSVVA